MPGIVKAVAAGALLLVAASCGSACDSSRAGSSPAQPQKGPAEPLPAVASQTVLAPPTPADAAASPPGEVRELTWSYGTTPVGPMQVVVAVPAQADDTHRLPVLIAMHGKGESIKGPSLGSRGWIDDYWLPRAVRRLHSPPVTSRDLLSMSDASRVARMNEVLSHQPYRGVIVVCPYTPDIMAGGRQLTAAALAAFLVDELLPRVYRETPALGTPASTGVDGVSLGGRAALLVGFERPEAFGAIGALQAAIDASEAPRLTSLAKHAVQKNPRLSLRLLSSDQDFYLEANNALSEAMKDAGIKHKLDVVPGPHGYGFNRGPGVVEMLLFHDRALRGEPPL